MRKRNWKYIIVAMIVIFAVILGVRQAHFQSVDSYRQEQRQLAKDVGSDLQENERKFMYGTPSLDSTERTGSDQRSGTGTKKVTSSRKAKAQKDQEESKTPASMEPSERPKSKTVSQSKRKLSKTDSSRKKKSDKNGSGTKASDKNKSDSKPSNKKPAQNSSQTSNSAVTDNSSQSTPDSTNGQDGQEQGNTSTSSGSGNVLSASPTATSKPQTEQITCTIEIRCDSLIANKKQAQQSIWKYIPSDGQIMERVSVKVDKGASVYDVLEKACKAKGVTVDATYTPMYKSYYIRGIGNIYEKQAGNMSGWIYNVNGTVPNRGASSYKVSDGDEISWRYTCDGKTT